jgi:hypothetical protein
MTSQLSSTLQKQALEKFKAEIMDNQVPENLRLTNCGCDFCVKKDTFDEEMLEYEYGQPSKSSTIPPTNSPIPPPCSPLDVSDQSTVEFSRSSDSIELERPRKKNVVLPPIQTLSPFNRKRTAISHEELPPLRNKEGIFSISKLLN